MIALLAAGLAAGACHDPAVIDPALDEPFVYLILNEKTTTPFVAPFRVQQAFLLTPGAPSEAPVYRGADRFVMERLSDRSTIAWNQHSVLETAPGQPVPRFPDLAWQDANYHVPVSPDGGLLGSEGVLPGQRYSLLIETGGVTLEGVVRVPDSLDARIEVEDGRIAVRWAAVTGAAGYWVTFADGPWYSLQEHTRFLVPDDAAAGGLVVVRALDPGLWLYMTEPAAARAGFVGNGYGVFGAVSADTVVLP